MPSLQSFSEDALDYVAQDLQSLSVEQMASIAASEQIEYETDSASADEVSDTHGVQTDASDDEDDSPLTDPLREARKRVAQTYASASDFDIELSALTIGSRDGKYERCFKMSFDSLLRSQHRSMTGASPIVHVEAERITSKPCLVDFRSDVLICARRSLDRHCYALLCQMVDEDFQRWDFVPEKLRKHICKRVGKMLLLRGICNEKGISYWHQNKGGTLAQRKRFKESQR